MPSIPLYPPPPPVAPGTNVSDSSNPLPQLLQTPSGLAILDLQGTINMPVLALHDPAEGFSQNQNHATHIGRLVFPDYSAANPPESTSWTKRVYLYVGRHQRLTGEVKKLPNPLAVISRKFTHSIDEMQIDQEPNSVADNEELKILEIVRWKILFSHRPEPVGQINQSIE